MRSAWLALSLLAAGCGSSTTLLLPDGTSGYSNAAPFAPRPGAAQVVFRAGDELIAYDADEGALDPLLVEAAPGVVDLAFRTDEQLYVLRQGALAVYVGGRVIDALPCAATGEARLAASEEVVWVTFSDDAGGHLQRLDEPSRALAPVLDLDAPIADVAAGPAGCYLATGDAVLRLVDRGDGTGELIFVLSIPGERLVSVASDPARERLYVATATATYVYASGRAAPLLPWGGRLRLDDDTLYVAAEGGLRRVTRASALAASLEAP